MVDKIFNALDSAVAWLCQVIYQLIAYLYRLFYNLGALRIIKNDKIIPIYNRVTLILGLAMLFFVVFQLIQYIIQPDNFTDKEKGFGKVMYRMIISVVLIAFVPNIFDMAFELQNDILQSNIVPKIILGTEDNYDEKWGGYFSASVLQEFYKINPNITDDTCIESNSTHGRDVVNANLTTLKDDGRISALSLCLNETSGDSTEKIIQFDGLLAVLSGALIAWMLTMYCLDLGVRVVQLTYLQIIAPIPIIMYMIPKKDGAFEKWVKQCATTFLDLFIRTAIICFVVLIISTLSSSFNDIKANVSASGQGDTMFTSLLYICLVLGVMTFAKKAGDMLKELFPKGNAASGELGLSTKNRIPEPAKRVAGAGIGLAAAGTLGMARRMYGAGKHALKKDKETRENLNKNYESARASYKKARRNYNNIRNDNTKTAAEKAAAAAQMNSYKKSMNEYKRQLGNERVKTGARFTVALGGGFVAGTLSGAKKGVMSGLTTKGGIGGIKKATDSVISENRKLDDWREDGGTTVGRIISGLEQTVGINPTEIYDRRKEKLEKENTALSKVTEYFGKGKEAIEKDIDDGKCDSISTKARAYRLKQIEAERLTVQAGNLKLTDFAYKDASERQKSESKIASMLKTPQQTLTQADYNKLDTYGKIEYNKNQKLMALAEQYYDADPKKVRGKKLQDLTGQEKENAISRILDRLADSACEVSYEETVKEYERESNDAKGEIAKLKKEAIQDIGDKVMAGGVKDASGQVIYQNAKAAQFIGLMKDAVDYGSSDTDLLLNQDLTTFAKLDDLNKAAGTQQNANSGEITRMQQSPEYKAAQANKKYNESGKK